MECACGAVKRGGGWGANRAVSRSGMEWCTALW